MTTDPGEPVILATLSAPAESRCRCLIDGYALPITVHAKYGPYPVGGTKFMRTF
jgi:hypothetical protein